MRGASVSRCLENPSHEVTGVGRKHLPALSGLRGVGAVWVVLYHFLGAIPVFSCGHLGVDLFFILSGFILTYVHFADFAKYSISSHLRFLQLRLVRIYPLHFCILIAFATIVLLLPEFRAPYPHQHQFLTGRFIATLFLVHNWFWPLANYWNGPSWSLSAEWLAYIFFPLAIATSNRVGWALKMPFAAIVLGITVTILIASGVPTLNAMERLGIVRMSGEFFAGCLLCQFVMDPRAKLLPWKAAQYIALLTIVFAVAFQSVRFLAPFGFGLLIMSCAQSPGIVARFLESRAVVFLGKISFSIYLCHWPLIQIENWVSSHSEISDRILDIVCAISIPLVSYVCWRFIEKPTHRLGRLWMGRRDDSLVSATEVAQPLLVQSHPG